MASGPAPKENAVRRNIPEFGTEIPKEPQPGRALPKTLPVKTPMAKRFWKTWAESPQSTTWLETDWYELEMTTYLVEQLFLGDNKLAGEIRQRVAKWGATNEDRARLRMKFEKDPEEPSEAPEDKTDVQMDEELFNRLRAV